MDKPRRKEAQRSASFTVKSGLAQMLKGGVIMDVVSPEHAVIAEEAGACAVMALERVPSDIRAQGGVARMSDPGLIREIMACVSIPVMAKCRIGHFVEAQILEAIGVDYVDESEVLTPADEDHHIYKHGFGVPFVCGCRNLGEALRRIGEGAAMIRSQGGGRNRRCGRSRAPRARRAGRDPAPAGQARRRADGLRQDHRRALRTGAADQGTGPPAGGQFRRRGSRHPGGCRVDDAAGRGRGLRGIGDIQEQ